MVAPDYINVKSFDKGFQWAAFSPVKNHWRDDRQPQLLRNRQSNGNPRKRQRGNLKEWLKKMRRRRNNCGPRGHENSVSLSNSR